jgi:AcrR family transcriptional regulator
MDGAMARSPAVRSSTSTPRWTRRKQARPAELIAAALEVFVERGFALARLDDVAARAGVTKGTLYLYFKNKEDLLEAVVRAALVPVVREAEKVVASYQGHTADLLRDLVAVWWQEIGATTASGIPKLVIAEAGNFPRVSRLYYDEVIEPVGRLISGLLERGVERGEFRPVNPEYATNVVMAPLIMLTLWMHSFTRYAHAPIDVPRYLETCLDVLLAGLARRTEHGETHVRT